MDENESGKVYFRVLERRLQPIREPQIQEEQCGFSPSRGTVDQIFTPIGGIMGLYLSSLHVFCGLGEGFRLCPPGSRVGCTAGVWSTRDIAMSYSVLI